MHTAPIKMLDYSSAIHPFLYLYQAIGILVVTKMPVTELMPLLFLILHYEPFTSIVQTMLIFEQLEMQLEQC
jgi:hypothetical protein